MVKVEIYTKDYCPHCTQAKQLLKSKGVDFIEYDVTDDEAKQKEMIERSGRMTVPEIFIDDKHIGGNDDLQALEEKGELDKLLK